MAIRQANAVETTKPAEATVAAAAVEPTAEAVASTQQVEVETVVDEAQVADPVVETTADPAAEEPAATREEASAAVLDEEPAPAAEAAATNAQAPQAETGTSIQPAAAGNTAVAVHGRSSFFQQILADLAEEGFEGIELDYSSFLNVTLNKQIETSEGGELPNAGFKVRLASARKKYCFRNNNPVEDEVEVAYSYDLNAPNDPESVVAQKIKEWREAGLDLAPGQDGIKVYQEVMAMMIDDGVEGEEKGQLNGRLITIQVAPTSKGRWAGYLAQLKMQKKQVSDVITLVRRGKKVESGKFPFYPWDFVNVGDATEL